MFSLKNKTVMITGGTGSFGRKCAMNFVQRGARKIIIFSRDEQKHVQMRRELFPPEQFPQVRFLIGDVRNVDRLRRAMRGVDVVIHAAAMKHVDMAEYNPQECIQTNIGGAENIINAAIDCGVERVVALSTDKAASPINLYGATKLCSDKLFVAANSLAGEDGTRFAVVRYGNVLGSNGSVVPLFQKLRSNGVFPITDPEMTRFIITLEQGVDLVVTALKWMNGGEIFVPKIPSTTIMDIAKAVGPECDTDIVGIRPGEKMHECMIPEDEARQTFEFANHYIIQPVHRWWTSEEPEYPEVGEVCPQGFSYASDNNSDWLTPSQLQNLIARHCNDGTMKQHAAA
ncbi:MAG: UDP-N-acetylglucosamine 4,6-dehydratase (inverting) [Pirellulaceae bacterium]